MTPYAYVYSYRDSEIHGKGMSSNEYLSLVANPGIYFIRFIYNEEWSVLQITEFGTYNALNNLEVPKEVKLHHLLTN